MNALMDTDFDIFSICVAYSYSKANERFNYIKAIFKMFIMMIDYESEDLFYCTLLLSNHCQPKVTKNLLSDHFTLIALAQNF